ncbi:MAG: AtpZ/AtpI family protein [Flavobacteriaceae bacterium]
MQEPYSTQPFLCVVLPAIRLNRSENLENPKKRRPNNWLVFSTLAFQLATIMWLCVRAGHWLDEHYSSSVINWTLLMTIGGMVMVIWRILQTTKRF